MWVILYNKITHIISYTRIHIICRFYQEPYLPCSVLTPEEEKKILKIGGNCLSYLKQCFLIISDSIIPCCVEAD